jgi:hypothetical protein
MKLSLTAITLVCLLAMGLANPLDPAEPVEIEARKCDKKGSKSKMQNTQGCAANK